MSDCSEWRQLKAKLASNAIFFAVCAFGALVLGWWFGWSWPWQRRELVSDLESANVALAEIEALRRMREAEEEWGRVVELSRLAEERRQAEVALLEKKISDLQEELAEAKAAAPGVGAGGPSTIRRRIPT